MANYKSRYTGEEIDAGIAKANTAIQDVSDKQDTLVSGTNIKTINGNSVLGSGNLVIEGGGGGLSSVAHDETLTGAGTNNNPLGVDTTEIATKDDLDDKQDKLVSGTNIKTINNQSILGSGNIIIEGGGSEANKSSINFIHVSFDDVTNSISNLASGSLNSIYDNQFIAALKQAHDNYGMTFSLYLQSIPGSITTKHQAELTQASKWLKFGLHALRTNYQNSTYAEGKTDWNRCVDAILKLTGCIDSVDRIPRLHQFYGTEVALQGMRDASVGALGFLSCDDTRPAYYFDNGSLNYLYAGENDHLTDHKNGLVFYRTDLRLDWFKNAGFTFNASSYSYHQPTDDSDISGELELRYKNSLYTNTFYNYEIFTHEWQPLSAIQNALEDIGEFALSHNIGFNFAQNAVCSPTYMDIYGQTEKTLTSISVTTLPTKNVYELNENLDLTGMVVTKNYNDGSTENTNDYTTSPANGMALTNAGTQQITVTYDTFSATFNVTVSGGSVDTISYGRLVVPIYTSLDDFEFVSPLSVGSGTTYEFPATTGRASCEAVLSVTPGSTITLNQNIDGVDLAYALKEGYNNNGSFSLSGGGAQSASAWLTGPTTLKSKTTLTTISFKRGDGASNFTAEELELLKSSLTIS